MARKSISQTEQQECKVAENANNKRKWEGSALLLKPDWNMRKFENTSRIVQESTTTNNQERKTNGRAYTAGLGDKKPLGDLKTPVLKVQLPPMTVHVLQSAITATCQKIICYGCGNQGHYKRDCPERKNQSHKNQIEGKRKVPCRAESSHSKNLLLRKQFSTYIMFCVRIHRTRLLLEIELVTISTKPPTEIRQFLSLAGYYRRFIEGFSKIAKPMTKLTQKKVKFEWGDKQEAAFQLLKQKLCSAPILALPEGSKDFIAKRKGDFLCITPVKNS
ncbi:putative reverse transcriptase domain-containing protein [Tanacetum coccineum]